MPDAIHIWSARVAEVVVKKRSGAFNSSVPVVRRVSAPRPNFLPKRERGTSENREIENKERGVTSRLCKTRGSRLERCRIVATVIKSEFGLRRDLANTVVEFPAIDSFLQSRYLPTERERERESLSYFKLLSSSRVLHLSPVVGCSRKEGKFQSFTAEEWKALGRGDRRVSGRSF